MKKCLKIICCYFGPRRATFNTPNNIIEYVIENLENEKKIDNGFPTDVVFVNNDCNNKESNEILNSYNNTETKNGKIFIETRENESGSFGAYYDTAFKYKDHYDYFFFSEDDVIIYKDNYIKDFIDFIDNNDEVGFVSLAPISKSPYYPRHSGGGCGLTTKEKFLKCNPEDYVKQFRIENNDRPIHIYGKLENLEVEFTNAFVRKDYQLKNHPKYSPLCSNFNIHVGHLNNYDPSYVNLEFIYKVG
jgi:hypothetical protein